MGDCKRRLIPAIALLILFIKTIFVYFPMQGFTTYFQNLCSPCLITIFVKKCCFGVHFPLSGMDADGEAVNLERIYLQECIYLVSTSLWDSARMRSHRERTLNSIGFYTKTTFLFNHQKVSGSE